MVKENLALDWGKPEPNPYQLEWNHYIDAIRNDLSTTKLHEVQWQASDLDGTSGCSHWSERYD